MHAAASAAPARIAFMGVYSFDPNYLPIRSKALRFPTGSLLCGCAHFGRPRRRIGPIHRVLSRHHRQPSDNRHRAGDGCAWASDIMSTAVEITGLLSAVAKGDAAAFERL